MNDFITVIASLKLHKHQEAAVSNITLNLVLWGLPKKFDYLLRPF